jgi:hypothetical protein
MKRIYTSSAVIGYKHLPTAIYTFGGINSGRLLTCLSSCCPLPKGLNLYIALLPNFGSWDENTY